MTAFNRPARSRPRAASAGFTLLEVLIAIVVVAFGLLGLAGLQVFALKNNQNASMRVTATAMANDMVDRMKANFLGVVAEGQDNYNRTKVSDYKTLVTSCNGASGDTCTPTQMAQNDRAEWQARLAASLPGGVGIVCVDSTPNDANPKPTDTDHGCDNAGTTVFVVKIWWDDRAQGTTAGTLKYHWTAFNP